MVRESSTDFLRIDISNGNTRKIISACQSDSVHRTIHFLLSNGGTPLDLSNIFYAEILIKRVNNTETDNPCIIDGEDISYTLKSNDVSCVGENECHLMLTFNDGTVMETPVFYLNVFNSFYNQAALQSQNDYSSLGQQVLNAKGYADDAAESASDASEYADNAQNYATSASQAESTAATTKSEIAVMKSETADYKTSTSEYMASASQYASNASSNAAITGSNVNSTSAYAASAAANASETANYKTSTSEYMASASQYASAAGSDAELGSSYMESTSEYASEAGSEASYASSCAGQAEYWYGQAEAIAESFAGALAPMGTVTFANLPAIADVLPGWMYNISDEFTTTSDFMEGAGAVIPAGSNVYLTATYKWDVLAGSPVTGVKGDSEINYRKGNVNITPANIGLGNVRNEDIGSGDISSLGANVKAAILALSATLANYQPLLTNPLTQADIVDALNSTSTTAPLSAAKGKVLRDDIGTLSSLTTTATSSIVAAINELDSRLAEIEGEIGYPIAPPSNNNNNE